MMLNLRGNHFVISYTKSNRCIIYNISNRYVVHLKLKYVSYFSIKKMCILV